MSLDTDREALAAILDAVPGVNGYPKRPNVARAGDAWPRLARLDLDRGLVWRPTWAVLVALPPGDDDQGAFIDQHFLPIVNALRATGNGFPDSAEPVYVPSSAGEFLALEITLRSF